VKMRVKVAAKVAAKVTINPLGEKTYSADEVRREIRRAVAAVPVGKGSDESRRTSSVSKIPVTREDLKGMMKEVMHEMNRSPEIGKLLGNAIETPRAFHISSC